MLVRAVIIHSPDFLVAALAAHVGDLRLRDARQAATQPRNDVVRELVRQAASIGVCRRATINFLQRDRRSRVVNIGKKSRGGQVCPFSRKIPVRDHVGAGGSIRPISEFQFAWLAWRLGRIKARADEIENSAVFQIGPENVVESFFQGWRRRRTQAKFRNGQADFRNAEAGARLEPVLSRGSSSAQQQRCCDCRKDYKFSSHMSLSIRFHSILIIVCSRTRIQRPLWSLNIPRASVRAGLNHAPREPPTYLRTRCRWT